MSHRFTVIFEKEDEGGHHIFCPALPGCRTQSGTIEEGMVNIREAIELYVSTLVEDGLPFPPRTLSSNPSRFPPDRTIRTLYYKVLLTSDNGPAILRHVRRRTHRQLPLLGPSLQPDFPTS